MAAEILTEDLVRLAREVVKTHPQFGEVLSRQMMRTCSVTPDPERAAHFRELGVLLVDLGRLYLAEAEELMGPPEVPEVQVSESE
ncbi:hypothetical protein OG205_13500 [Lentzea sp. NBC_00516]|uniref:hypothetical protein n=1 Tax=Lentzea sp. NBC_00516 TaxID=2903582 RepID=UPI002E80DDC7|nr:hypothetical protein [Lentzea sp. NBC_00516]WUD27966.1 hypothetical protein OG205_13500 [Lentzea sp. NBC_00516]